MQSKNLDSTNIENYIYITSFNKEKYLEKSIVSVLNQSLKPYDLVIIDDFSSDNSREIITAFKK